MKIIQKTELLRDPNLLHCKKALDIPNLGNPGDTILYYKAGLRSRSRIRSRKESDALGGVRVGFLTPLGVGVGFCV